MVWRFSVVCGVSSEQTIVVMRRDVGDVLCQPCYRLDHLEKVSVLRICSSIHLLQFWLIH